MKPFNINSFPIQTVFVFGVLLAADSARSESLSTTPLWELGAFGVGVSQQAYPGSDQQVSRGLVLPYLVYRGRFLRADRETAGLRAIKTPSFELDVGVAGSFGAKSDDIKARSGMPDLGTLVEFGPRLRWNIGEVSGAGALRMELPLRGVFDLSDRAAHRGMAFEPRLVLQRSSQDGWNYTTGVGAIFADQRLAQTFYGVDPAYAETGRPAYHAQSGLVAWRLTASFSKNLSRDWRLFGFGRFDSLAGAANEASPLVKRTSGGPVGIGIAYTWLRSDRTASD